MSYLGQEVSGPFTFKYGLANNVTIKCLWVIQDVEVRVFEVEVAMYAYVMPSKGEGCPIILGRPLLIAMHATQDWEVAILVMKT